MQELLINQLTMKIKNWPLTILFMILALSFSICAVFISTIIVDRATESLFYTCLFLVGICIVCLLYTNSDFK